MKIIPALLSRTRLVALARRVLFGLGVVLLLALAVGGIIVSQVDFVAAEKAAIERLRVQTGVSIAFQGREEARFPAPHITYTNLTLSRAGNVHLQARQAELRFSLIDLLDGTLDAPTLRLLDAEAMLDARQLSAPLRSPRALIDMLEFLPAMFERQQAISRLKLSMEAKRFRLVRDDGTVSDEFGPLGLSLDYSGEAGRLAVRITQAGSGAPGADVPLSQQPLKLAFVLPTRRALAAGSALPARLDAAIGDSTISLNGTMRAQPDTTLSGKLESRYGAHFEQLLGFSGGQRREARTEPGRLTADLVLDPRGIALDNLSLSLAKRGLSGIAALREAAGRWTISATLAGDLVDGTAAYRMLQGVRDERGSWSKEVLNLNPFPLVDLDVRLSTKAFRLGRFALQNVGLAILTRATRAEMAIVDSHYGDGRFKARVVVGDSGTAGQTLKLSASGENMAVGDMLDQAFGFERLSGNGSFVLQAQGQGGSVAALVGSLGGTAAFDLREGIINGIDLARLMNRAADQRAESALLLSLVGKTVFEAMRADFAIQNGRLETVGSRFLTREVDGVMEGYSELGSQQHRQAIILRKRNDGAAPSGEFFGFRLEGALLSPSIKPDNRLLQDRR